MCDTQDFLVVKNMQIIRNTDERRGWRKGQVCITLSYILGYGVTGMSSYPAVCLDNWKCVFVGT